MRARPNHLLLALIALLASGAQATAGAETKAGPKTGKNMVVELDSIAPSQTEVGIHAARMKVDEWRAKARDKGVSFDKYVDTKLRKKFATLKLTSIRDHKGVVRNLDGHHKLYALHAIARETGIKLPVQVQLVHDYKGQKLGSYAKHFVGELGSGYFGSNPTGKNKQLIKSLPKSYDGLRDNPMRSILGATFKRMGVKGSMFVDYVQFHLGDQMLRDGLLRHLRARGVIPSTAKSIPADRVADPAVSHHVESFLFRSKPLMASLEKMAKPEHKKTIREALSRARAAHARTTPPMPGMVRSRLAGRSLRNRLRRASTRSRSGLHRRPPGKGSRARNKAHQKRTGKPMARRARSR